MLQKSELDYTVTIRHTHYRHCAVSVTGGGYALSTRPAPGGAGYAARAAVRTVDNYTATGYSHTTTYTQTQHTHCTTVIVKLSRFAQGQGGLAKGKVVHTLLSPLSSQ